MMGARSQKALIYNPGSSKDLCGLNILVFLLNRNLKKGRGGKERKPQCVFHTHHTVTAKPIKNCTTAVLADLQFCAALTCNTRTIPDYSGESAALDILLVILCVSLIKPEWFVPIFWLKAFEKTPPWLISAQEMRGTKLYLGSNSKRARHPHRTEKNNYIVKFP